MKKFVKIEYAILDKEDVELISQEVNYDPKYVRSVLKGWTKQNKRNLVIIEAADKYLLDKGVSIKN